ncbi:DHH phosphoesterase [Martensiomyces pterosporus]|nr:DHH phosphoesterase [Martensiomyces pterosporus]
MSAFGAFVRSLSNNTARLNDPCLGQLGSKLTLVLGNESADLDSMVSSISLAYALSQSQASSSPPPIPIININRADLALRPECDLLLRETLVAEGSRGVEDLTFIDDFDLHAVLQQFSGASTSDGYVVPELEVWLTDHNAPASRQAFLEPYVKGIVDHHVDEGKCEGAEWRQVEMVGSCTTLVARKIKELGDPVDKSLARMLLAPVLIDTSNLNPAAKRATSKDVAVVEWLDPLVDWSQPAVGISATAPQPVPEDDAPEESLAAANAGELYKTLDKLKGKVSHLSSYDLLRKDYKQWQVADMSGKPWAVGISSISYRLKKWLKRDGKKAIESAIHEWTETQGLDMALVMTHGKAKNASGTKVYGRDLTVAFRQDGKQPNDVQELLVRGLRSAEVLGLQDYFEDSRGGDTLFFSQGRIESSRKQVFPAVKGVIEAVSSETTQQGKPKNASL